MTSFEQIRQLLTLHHLDALLIENPIDLFYLTQLRVSVGKLLITPQSTQLFVDSRYIEMAKKEAKIAVFLDNPEHFAALISPLKKLGVDGAFSSWERVEKLKKDFPQVEIISIPSPLKEIRAIKTEIELELMKKAAALGSLGCDYVISLLKEGVEEKELAYKLDLFWKERGASGFAFEPIIAFGENSALPHARAGTRKLKKGDTVLIDIGVVLDNYHSDMTRTLFFGEPDPRMIEVYHVVKEAQKRAFDFVKEGVTAQQADKVARDYITSKGYGCEFSHSLGHSIGIETHEWPTLRSQTTALAQEDIILKSNMCVTLEPGIYIPGLGGVRIEDTVIVKDTYCESITHRPTELLKVSYA